MDFVHSVEELFFVMTQSGRGRWLIEDSQPERFLPKGGNRFGACTLLR